MILPIPIGYSRAGLEIADLVEFPHLLVAGMTYGGKSNFLHQMIVSLLKRNFCQVSIIDMKRLEFEPYRSHAEVAFTMPAALHILRELRRELFRRMELFSRLGIVKIQKYIGGDLPYMVLVIDEFSQLCPKFAKDEGDKKDRAFAHSYLVDLLCLARCVGIHVVISTQRPDKDILPGQLKANIPATLCFKVRNEVNSRICLDNDRAAYLPPIKGRAIYQFDVEREVQVMYFPVDRLNEYLSPVRPVGRSAVH